MFDTLSCIFNGSGTVAAQKKYHRQVPLAPGEGAYRTSTKNSKKKCNIEITAP